MDVYFAMINCLSRKKYNNTMFCKDGPHFGQVL